MSRTAYRRARGAFWICVAAAVVLTGALGGVLRAEPGPVAGIAFVVLGVLLAGVVALATRLLLALTGRLPARGAGPPPARGVNPPPARGVGSSPPPPPR